MFFCITVLVLLIENVFANAITPVSDEKHVLEGETVSLSCNYSGSNINSFQWYRQNVNTAPEYLLQTFENVAPHQKGRHLAKAEKNMKQLDLEISNTEVTDSVIYYCALNDGTRKIHFGKGTTLHVQSKEVQKPSFYKVNNDSCLATDFTQHNALDGEPAFSGQNISVRYDGEKTYSAFALGAGRICTETEGCKEGSSGQTVEVESDEKMNFMSLGIFWLRIVFLKTVVFNVLMTVKAWMS